MRLSQLLATTIMISSTVAACSSDGGTTTHVDAHVVAIDAPAQAIDAPPGGLTGLGQKCGTGLPACPSTAMQCVGLAGLTGAGQYCTPKCETGGTSTSNAQGQFAAITPTPSTTACPAAFTGSVGAPTCGIILAYSPMDNPIVANKAYTGIDLGCVIVCGTAMACPSGTVAKMAGTTCLCVPPA